MTEQERSCCEDTLRKAFGFVSGRLALDEAGEVVGIYLVDRGGDDPTAVIAAVRRYLQEHCGEEVDPSTISLTQLGGEARLRLDHLTLQEDPGQAQAVVILSRHGLTLQGTAARADTQLAAAAAATDGVNSLLGTGAFFLRDLRRVEMGGRMVMLAALEAAGGLFLVGASPLRDDPAAAAARAVLAAVNRHLDSHVSARS